MDGAILIPRRSFKVRKDNDENGSTKAELIDQLLVAIEDSRAVFITYQSERATEAVSYDVHPYGLIEHRGSLYLVGFSPSHDNVRIWKLDRMQDVDVTRVPFQRPVAAD